MTHELNKKLAYVQKHLRKKHEQEGEAAQRKKEAQQENLEKERILLPGKLEDAIAMFAWSAQFTASKEYHELTKLMMKEHGGTDLHIYDGDWGHHNTHNDNHGCWSQTRLSKEGSILYRSGYKWMGVSYEIRLTTPERMAEQMHSHYIRSLRRHLENGTVYKSLTEILDRFIR